MEVKCIIKDEKDNQWEEVLRVKSLDTAKEDIQDILDCFNSELKSGESKRELVKVLKEKTVADKTSADKRKDFCSLLSDLRHEDANGFGNAWVKSKFPLIMRAYDTLINTGKSRVLNAYIQECFSVLHDIPERLHYLEHEDIVSFFQDEKEQEWKNLSKVG